jgi:hypothetical protein
MILQKKYKHMKYEFVFLYFFVQPFFPSCNSYFMDTQKNTTIYELRQTDFRFQREYKLDNEWIYDMCFLIGLQLSVVHPFGAWIYRTYLGKLLDG